MPATRLVTGGPKVGTRPGAAATTKLNEVVVAVAPLASVAVTEIGKVPEEVGVPERTPEELRVTPVGKALEVEKLIGEAPPVAERLSE